MFLCKLQHLPAASTVSVPLRNLIYMEGVRSNLLVGYGLVVGLSGTGDTLRSSPFTKESMIAMLNRLGVNTKLGGPGTLNNNINTRNTAAVMVTAKLPPFARQGNPIDVSVSAMGDARSLRGGTLLVTPLMAADGNVYAVAQGSLASSAFRAQGAMHQGRESGTSVVKGVPTAAHIPGGGLVEREVPFQFKDSKTLKLCLQTPNFTTATRIVEAITESLPDLKPEAIDPGTILIQIPADKQNDLTNMLSELEGLQIIPCVEGRVIINERDGVIVISDDVRVNQVAVCHGSLTISIQESFQTSQPTNLTAVSGGSRQAFSQSGSGLAQSGNAGAGNALGGVQTVNNAISDINVNEQTQKIGLVKGVSLKALVAALNAFNLPIGDLSAVLRAIKTAGALHAKLEIS